MLIIDHRKGISNSKMSSIESNLTVDEVNMLMAGTSLTST